MFNPISRRTRRMMVGIALFAAGLYHVWLARRVPLAAARGQTAASAVLSAIKLWPEMFEENA